MTNLRHLRLHQVDFSTSVPKSLANLSFLTTLSLNGCTLHGNFPENVFQLHKLDVIIAACNHHLTGILPEFQPSNSLRELRPLPSSIWNISQLTYLDLSSNHFTGHVLPSISGSLAKLTHLMLESCQFSGELPSSLGNLTRLEVLSLPDNSFTRQIPCTMFKLANLTYVNLENNNLSGTVELGKFLEFLALSGNKLYGSFTFPPLFTSISYFSISQNNLTGIIQPSIRKWTGLKVLDMSENHFSGTIPRWLVSSLEVLNLQGNNFNGSIPHEIFANGDMHNMMRVLDLSHNQFQGRVPQSLINCSKLQVLNLGHNQISDTFPFWLHSLPELQVLMFRSNKFFGPIWHPIKYLGFANLGNKDLSSNNFSGSLPSEYFKYWVHMAKAPVGNKADMIYFDQNKEMSDYSIKYAQPMSMMNKGSEMELGNALKIFTSIDFSNNRFDGDIPSSICKLQSLTMLNLSSNNFTGTMPSSLGSLSELESLDLSKNKLSGRIPQQLANLTFLEHLNLSHNQLTGPIPQGTQLDTFSYSSFQGNPGLCGPQLSMKCENTDIIIPFLRKDDEKESENGFTWKVVAIGYGCGFVVGAVIGHATRSRRSTWFWRSCVGRCFYRFMLNVEFIYGPLR
ncbi:hypothetical protein FNV43_RR01720 [Rhamnella rubrinervis]|uniref:Uncharacterized protein n=1 Tax=Rhamnella rubrinervis TaxID=2594499 RepID=A0A8K0HSU5_9ROSA|nr:hypothetical protein FNV43_RR01720 [Rhamnella rubrinervis]